jgi:hypothetical protein
MKENKELSRGGALRISFRQTTWATNGGSMVPRLDHCQKLPSPLHQIALSRLISARAEARSFGILMHSTFGLCSSSSTAIQCASLPPVSICLSYMNYPRYYTSSLLRNRRDDGGQNHTSTLLCLYLLDLTLKSKM